MKLKTEQKTVNSFCYLEQIYQNVQFYGVSAKTGKNIPVLKSVIFETIKVSRRSAGNAKRDD